VVALRRLGWLYDGGVASWSLLLALSILGCEEDTSSYCVPQPNTGCLSLAEAQDRFESDGGFCAGVEYVEKVVSGPTVQYQRVARPSDTARPDTASMWEMTDTGPLLSPHCCYEVVIATATDFYCR